MDKWTHGKENGVIISHRDLSPEACDGLIAEFVSRDGTDSGYTRLSHSQRKAQVKRQLDRGEAVIVYDEVSQTANIVPKEDLDLR